MDANKVINEFQNMNEKLIRYEKEREELQFQIKLINKENKKLTEKIEKEKDEIIKSLYTTKVVANQYFIKLIKSIFNFRQSDNSVIKEP